MRSTRATLVTALVAPLLLVLTGCTPVVVLDAADDAANPACAPMMVRLPDTVGGLPSRSTDAQATAAWGEPATVLLRCGVPSPAPTATLPCITVAGIDWLRDDADDPNFVFTTYGRSPAVEVIIDSDGDPDVGTDGVSGFEALSDLAAAVSEIPADRACVSPEDTTR
ncbi:MAG: DUF3515 family protein [Rhodoglobus sp.]|uniref:DUF3515 family protein n=1 Tax=Salinibacterium sp. G-O1 TaxID=3046208 RepID=UPI0024B97A1D|nr:DUF3515 family protein [Salinibacterium sp. G-O1]MDJ0335763.1 DUF3515 family protein [Salinibacterium sp. G-O1]